MMMGGSKHLLRRQSASTRVDLAVSQKAVISTLIAMRTRNFTITFLAYFKK
jgi:hypothetical protein